MIDFNSEYNSFSNIDKKSYINKIQSNVDNENIEEAINCYNEGLKEIKANNDDIASIQLKKALTYFPDFIEAKVILALYKIKVNEIEKAIKLLEEVKMDNYYAFKANDYLHSINKKSNNKIKNSHSKKMPTWIILITGIIVGGIIGFVFASNSADNQVSNDNEQISNTIIIEKENALKKANQELKSAKNSLSTLKNKIKEYESTNEYYKNIYRLIEAENMYNTDKKTEAARILLDLKSVDFQGQEQEKFKELYSFVTNDVSTQLYNEGYLLYERKQYDEALIKFKESLRFNNNFKYASRSMYYAGRCCQINEDIISASMYFNQLINNYPNDNYSVYAQRRLNEIN